MKSQKIVSVNRTYPAANNSKYVTAKYYNALKDDFDEYVFKSDIINASTATLGLTAKDSNKLILLNRAAGVTVSLPTAEVGLRFRFLVNTDVTSNGYIINTQKTTDLFTGGVTITDSTTPEAPDMFKPDLSNDDSMTMNGSTTGGLIGSAFEIICTSANRWYVTGFLDGAGTLATPFS